MFMSIRNLRHCAVNFMLLRINRSYIAFNSMYIAMTYCSKSYPILVTDIRKSKTLLFTETLLNFAITSSKKKLVGTYRHDKRKI